MKKTLISSTNLRTLAMKDLHILINIIFCHKTPILHFMSFIKKNLIVKNSNAEKISNSNSFGNWRKFWFTSIDLMKQRWTWDFKTEFQTYGRFRIVDILSCIFATFHTGRKYMNIGNGLCVLHEYFEMF